MKHSLALVALVAVASISPSSALFGLRGEPDDWAIKPIPHTSEWSLEKFMQTLSTGYQPERDNSYLEKYGPGDELPGAVYSWLSRTQDKKKPKTILNKYSLQDLLDLNLVYDKEATLQEYDRRKRMCEDFAPDEVSDEKWRSESRFAQSDEAKLQNQKYFLSQYCWKTFRAFRSGAQINLDKQLERKLAKEDNENFSNFKRGFIDYYEGPQNNRDWKWDELIEGHLKSYDKEKLAKLKTSCLKLDRFAETYRLEEFSKTKFGSMFGFCKKIKTF